MWLNNSICDRHFVHSTAIELRWTWCCWQLNNSNDRNCQNTLRQRVEITIFSVTPAAQARVKRWHLFKYFSFWSLPENSLTFTKANKGFKKGSKKVQKGFLLRNVIKCQKGSKVLYFFREQVESWDFSLSKGVIEGWI